MAKTIEKYRVAIPSNKADVNVDYSIVDADLGKSGSLIIGYDGLETVDAMMARVESAIKTQEAIA